MSLALLAFWIIPAGFKGSCMAVVLLFVAIHPVICVQNTTCSGSCGARDEEIWKRAGSKEEKFAAAVCRGERLLKALNTQDLGPASPFTNYDDDLTQAGYTTAYKKGRIPYEDFGTFLGSVGVPKENVAYKWTTIQDKTATSGMYDFWVCPEHNILYAQKRYRSMDPAKNNLWRPSDFMALAWGYIIDTFYGGETQDIKYLLAGTVANSETQNILQTYGPLGDYPGKIWGMDTEMGKAVLGSPNGNSFGWMIMQRPDLFPLKTFSEVQAFKFFDISYSMIFYLKDVVVKEDAPIPAL